MKKVILFDFFGVICQDISWAWYEKNVDDTPQNREALTKILKAYDTGEMTKAMRLEEMARLADSTPEAVQEELSIGIAIDQKVVEIIKELAKTYELGVLSNASSAGLRSILDEYKLTQYFAHITASGDIGVAKPLPQIYEAALKAHGINPEEALFIDDNVLYVEAAKRLGIQGLRFESAATLRADLIHKGITITK